MPKLFTRSHKRFMEIMHVFLFILRRQRPNRPGFMPAPNKSHNYGQRRRVAINWQHSTGCQRSRLGSMLTAGSRQHAARESERGRFGRLPLSRVFPRLCFVRAFLLSRLSALGSCCCRERRSMLPSTCCVLLDVARVQRGTDRGPSRGARV